MAPGLKRRLSIARESKKRKQDLERANLCHRKRSPLPQSPENLSPRQSSLQPRGRREKSKMTNLYLRTRSSTNCRCSTSRWHLCPGCTFQIYPLWACHYSTWAQTRLALARIESRKKKGKGATQGVWRAQEAIQVSPHRSSHWQWMICDTPLQRLNIWLTGD